MNVDPADTSIIRCGLFFLLSALHYFADDLVTAVYIAQGRWTLANPWFSTAVWLIVSAGLILMAIAGMARTPDRVKYLPQILVGFYLLLRGQSALEDMRQRLETDLDNPERLRQLFQTGSLVFLLIGVLLVVGAAAAGRR